jgi:hypothetical protein
MQRTPLLTARNAVATLALAVLAAGAAPGARAESDPYYFGINQSLGHSSNVYSVDNQRVPDKFATTSLNFGFDQPISRQRLFANASVRATRYEDITILNNTGYGLSAGWDLSTIERLSGGIGVSVNRSLANYAAAGDQTQVPQTKKNEETSSSANLRVQYGLVSLLSLNTSLSHSEIRYSASEYDRSEVRQNAGSLGLTYRPSGLLTLGSAYRVTRGEYPNIPLPNGKTESFNRKDLDLTTTWIASGLSTINGRLSYGRTTYETLTDRDTKGLTGSLGWDWQLTGKTSVNTSISRDSGTETSLATLAKTQGNAVGDNSVTTNTFILGASYEATSKIRLNLGARYARRTLANEQVVNGVVVASTEGRDSVTSVTLGATYVMSRAWQMGCNAAQDTGRPDSGSTTLSTKYTTTQASCNVQLTIR